jgi:ribosomal protein S12 methylthiotransferase
VSRPPSRPIKVSLVSLGCPKNLVDSEVMVGKLTGGAFELQSAPEGSDVVVVNTCGFIDAAKEESIDTICEMLDLKAQGAVKGVVVAGCMVRRYGSEMQQELPDVDAFLDISDYSDAPRVFKTIHARTSGETSPARAESIAPFVGGGADKSPTADLGRSLLTLPHTAYLRVSEGCDRKCAFCAIPLIRGTQKSKPIDVLVKEAKRLAAAGVKELSLVGEETTAYGSDLGMAYGEGIAPLLRALSKVKGIEWIRLLYAHPGSFKRSLIDEIRDNPKVAKYVDMPIQHGDDEILKRMKRGTPAGKIRDLVATLRSEIPGITLRTTILVGFPGETDTRFEHLMDTLRATRFERVGCFTYSREEGTSSHDLTGRVSGKVAAERRRKVMLLSRKITKERNKALLGTTIRVLLDAVDGDRAVGRSEGDAPQIDCRVHVRAPEGVALEPGAFIDVRVDGVLGYDLKGTACVGAGVPA